VLPSHIYRTAKLVCQSPPKYQNTLFPYKS